MACADAGSSSATSRPSSNRDRLSSHISVKRCFVFDDSDFIDGGSDRLVDGIVAWGSVDDIHDRLAAQADAGASRVVVIPLNAAGGKEPDWVLLAELGS